MMTRAAHKTVLNLAFWSGSIAYDGWRLPPDVKAGTRQLALAMLPKPKLAANLFRRPSQSTHGDASLWRGARRFGANFAKLSELLKRPQD
jgi:hypothetical protein